VARRCKRCGQRFRRHPDRAPADADPSGVDPRHEHLGQPGAQHRPGLVRGRSLPVELWLFWAAPIIGAIIAGLLARRIYEREALIQTIVVEESRVA